MITEKEVELILEKGRATKNNCFKLEQFQESVTGEVRTEGCLFCTKFGRENYFKRFNKWFKNYQNGKIED